MAGIICKWLNLEVKLPKIIEYGSIGDDFRNGYLFAYIFWKYGLLNNLNNISDFNDDESLRRNFALLEPLWEHMQIEVTDDMTRDIQMGNTSSIIDLLYKLFVSLESQKYHIQPEVAAKGMNIQQERALAMSEIDESINLSVEACWRLQEMISTKQMELNVKYQERQDKMKKYIDDQSKRISESLRKYVPQQNAFGEPQSKMTYAKVREYVEEKKRRKKQEEITSAMADLDKFDQKLNDPPLHRKVLPQNTTILLKSRLEKYKTIPSDGKYGDQQLEDYRWNQQFIDRIRDQLSEELQLRIDRKTKKLQIIDQQVQLFQASEREQIENILVDILLRQSKFERKLINELMQIRKEKSVILESRRLHNKLLTEMRENEFSDALDAERRKSEVKKYLEKEQTRRDWEFHKLLLAKHRAAAYSKHYDVCREIVLQIVDFSICVSHHLVVTGEKIPPRLWREWKLLFIKGKSYFSHVEDQDQLESPWEIDIEDIRIEEDRLNALDESEFQDYKNHANEWAIPSSCEIRPLNMKRSIIGHLIYTILDQVYPFPPPLRTPIFPYSPTRLCILGKPFVGKSAVCEKIVQGLNDKPFVIIKPQHALEDALRAYHECEDILNTASYDASSILLNWDTSESSLNITEATTITPRTASKSASYDPLMMKDVPRDEELKDQTDEIMPYFELTPLAVLGFLAWNELKDGNEIDDNLIVKIILEIVRQLPGGVSWILDGFPVNLQQGKYLEQGLTSYYTPEDLYILHTTEIRQPNIYELRSSHLVDDPDPPGPPPPPKSAFDMIIYLSAEDKDILQATSVFLASTDVDWDLTQLTIHHRLEKFNQDWTDLEDWFTEMNVLQKIPVQDYMNVEGGDDALAQIIIQLIGGVLRSNLKSRLSRITEASAQESRELDDIFVLNANDKCVQFPTPSLSLMALNTKRMPAGDDKDKELLSSTDHSIDLSESFTPSSIDESPISTKEASPCYSWTEAFDDMLPAIPGDANWQFVKEFIPLDVAKIIADIWQNMEMTFINVTKTTFRKLRQYQDCVIRSFYTTQEDFVQFLHRPDDKQKLIGKWQEEYNAIEDDMRSDEETKSELHMRIDDLRHVLWEMCDERLEEAKSELFRIVSSGWLDDWLLLISNRYLCLIQAELDRFFDTIQVIFDYYDTLEGINLREVVNESVRIPIIDMGLHQNDSSSSGPETKKQPSDIIIGSLTSEGPKSIIPLLTRHDMLKKTTTESHVSTTKTSKYEDGVAYGSESCENLVHRTYLIAIQAVDKKMNSTLFRGDEVNDALHHKRSRRVDTALSKEMLTPRHLHEPKEKVNLEYHAAIAEEENCVRSNLWLIENVALRKINQFTKHSSDVYENLEYLLKNRYRKELESVEDACRLMAYAVEEERQLQEELVLNDDVFFVNGDVILFPTREMDSTTAYFMESTELEFSVNQIRELNKQFSLIAPDGFLSSHLLGNITNDLITRENPLTILPDSWLQLRNGQVRDLVDYVSCGREIVNWKLFLVYLTKPWRQPNEIELIEALDRFHSIDDENSGYVFKEQYDEVDFWLRSEDMLKSASVTSTFSGRVSRMKDLFFEIFSMREDTPRLDYVELLTYFCGDHDDIIGFTKALSLGCNFPIWSEIMSSGSSKSKAIKLTPPTPKISVKSAQILRDVVNKRPTNYLSSFSGFTLSSSENELLCDECPIPFSVVFQVFQYTQPYNLQSSRVTLNAAETLLEELENVYFELGSSDCEPVPYIKLMESPVIRSKIRATGFFKEIDVYNYVKILLEAGSDDSLYQKEKVRPMQ